MVTHSTPMMRLQVTMYALAAKHELELEPEQGLVRYLGEPDPARRELAVELDAPALQNARDVIRVTAAGIRGRELAARPGRAQRRCARCDFETMCGVVGAVSP